MDLKDKILLITGGANGIGHATVKEFLRNGIKHIAILDLANSNGDAAVEKLNAEFGKDRVIFIVCDITKPEELEAAYKKTIDKFNGLDIVINNAGMMRDSLWERMIDLNVTAVVRSSLLALQHMGKHKGGKGGTVVNISSIVSLAPHQPVPIYAATKYAVRGLTVSLAESYETTGVRCLTMCPGVTITPLITEVAGSLLDFIEFAISAGHSIQQPIYIPQSVDDMAKSIVLIVKKGENGSVWVSEDAKPAYEIKFPSYQTLKVPSDD